MICNITLDEFIISPWPSKYGPKRQINQNRSKDSRFMGNFYVWNNGHRHHGCYIELFNITLYSIIIFLDHENMGLGTNFIMFEGKITDLWLISMFETMADAIIDVIEPLWIVLHHSKWPNHIPWPWKHILRHYLHVDWSTNNEFMHIFVFRSNGRLYYTFSKGWFWR